MQLRFFFLFFYTLSTVYCGLFSSEPSTVLTFFPSFFFFYLGYYNDRYMVIIFEYWRLRDLFSCRCNFERRVFFVSFCAKEVKEPRMRHEIFNFWIFSLKFSTFREFFLQKHQRFLRSKSQSFLLKISISNFCPKFQTFWGLFFENMKVFELFKYFWPKSRIFLENINL